MDTKGKTINGNVHALISILALLIQILFTMD